MICPQCKEDTSVLLLVRTPHGMAQICRVCRDAGVVPKKMPLVQKIALVILVICIIAIFVTIAMMMFSHETH